MRICRCRPGEWRRGGDVRADRAAGAARRRAHAARARGRRQLRRRRVRAHPRRRARPLPGLRLPLRPAQPGRAARGSGRRRDRAAGAALAPARSRRFPRRPGLPHVMALEVFDQATASPSPPRSCCAACTAGPSPRAGSPTPTRRCSCVAARGGSTSCGLRTCSGCPARTPRRSSARRPRRHDPERVAGGLVAVEDYLTGDVRARSATAQPAAHDDERYRRNVELLGRVQPPTVGPLDIAVSLGAPWIDSRRRRGLHPRGARRPRPRLAPALGRVLEDRPARQGTGRPRTARGAMSAYEVLRTGSTGARRSWSTRRQRRAGQAHPPPQRRGVDRRPGAAARARGPVHRVAVAGRRPHRTARRASTTTGSPATGPGTSDGDGSPCRASPTASSSGPGSATSSPARSPRRPRCARTRSAPARPGRWRCCALTARRLGLARKPLVAVPAHLVEQTAREFRQAYPFGRFLVVGRTARGRAPGWPPAAPPATGTP